VEFIAGLEPLVGSLRGRPVLDLGCGRRALWTRAYLGRGARVVALELDLERCVEARRRLAGVDGGAGEAIGVVRGDGERLPLDDGAFAFVHCAQVLEHVRSPSAFLAELRRILAPGGHAYVTAINRHALRDPHFGVIGVNYLPRGLADRVLGWIGAENPEHQALSSMHYFSRAGFRRLCAASGFAVVADLKRRDRLVRHGPLAGRVADVWAGSIRSAAFHFLLARSDELLPRRVRAVFPSPP
jgi:ubiquinone/menaquinone biosynthesis C-methylase UbiE